LKGEKLQAIRFPLRSRRPAKPAEKGALASFRKELSAWLQVLVIVFGGLFGLYKYLDEQTRAEEQRRDQIKNIERDKLAQAERDNLARLIEAQKPFLQLQFDTYKKANTLVGRMILLKPDDPEYKKLRDEFESLYWAELALVEDRGVAAAMINLGDRFRDYEADNVKQVELKVGAINLAHALRDSIRSGWEGGIKRQ
jgi:hypothetical protein